MSMTLEQAQEVIALQEQQLRTQANQIGELLNALIASQRRGQQLQEQVQRLLKRLYGPKSEAFLENPDQLLFDDLLASVLEQARDAGRSTGAAPDLIPPENPVSRPRRRHNHGRMDLEVLESVLECEDVIVDVSAEEKCCPVSGDAMVEIGREVTRKLEIRPGRILIKRYIRPKFASRRCPEAGVVLAELPAFPIPKCKLDVGLMADILVSKYMDHKPLYRIERSLKREGVVLSRRTMSGIALRCGVEVLLPLYTFLKAFVLSFRYLFSDDTRMPIQVHNVAEADRDELGSPRMWVYGNAVGPRQVFYDFTLNRGNQGPDAILSGYTGYLQADAYSGYDIVFNSTQTTIVEVGCWAHTRRKFDEALDSSPRYASEVLGAIRELYLIERQGDNEAGDAPEMRKAIRQQYAKPIVEALYTRFDAILEEGALPKSPIAKAIGYAKNQRQALERFLDDGVLRLDNNWAENHMRPLALGRKNYLFVGSKRGGTAAAIIYSFAESCRLVNVNPVDYFKDVLWRIASHPPDRLSELLPCNWKPGKPPGDRIIMPPMPRRQNVVIQRCAI